MKFLDGTFTFWTAHYGSWANDKRIIFRVRSDSSPRIRAYQKEIKFYDRILPAQEEEISAWLGSHPDYMPINQEFDDLVFRGDYDTEVA